VANLWDGETDQGKVANDMQTTHAEPASQLFQSSVSEPTEALTSVYRHNTNRAWLWKDHDIGRHHLLRHHHINEARVNDGDEQSQASHHFNGRSRRWLWNGKHESREESVAGSEAAFTTDSEHSSEGHRLLWQSTKGDTSSDANPIPTSHTSPSLRRSHEAVDRLWSSSHHMFQNNYVHRFAAHGRFVYDEIHNANSSEYRSNSDENTRGLRNRLWDSTETTGRVEQQRAALDKEKNLWGEIVREEQLDNSEHEQHHEEQHDDQKITKNFSEPLPNYPHRNLWGRPCLAPDCALPGPKPMAQPKSIPQTKVQAEQVRRSMEDRQPQQASMVPVAPAENGTTTAEQHELIVQPSAGQKLQIDPLVANEAQKDAPFVETGSAQSEAVATTKAGVAAGSEKMVIPASIPSATIPDLTSSATVPASTPAEPVHASAPSGSKHMPKVLLRPKALAAPGQDIPAEWSTVPRELPTAAAMGPNSEFVPTVAMQPNQPLAEIVDSNDAEDVD